MSELFELSILGGAVERRWRRTRPEIMRLRWDTLTTARLAPGPLHAARTFWTTMALQEHRTAAAAAATVHALVAARAPIDLVAHAAGFVTDELAHVELCARVAAGLGGAAPTVYDADRLLPRATPRLTALGRAAELVLRVYCVGEALSLPMQQATARHQRHPLLAGVLRRLARDEAAHAAFGWLFFDWATPFIDGRLRSRLRRVAAGAVAELATLIDATPAESETSTFGWLPRAQWRSVAQRALDADVCAPLRARGLLG